MNIDISVVGILNQLFLGGFYTETKFSKKNNNNNNNKVVSGKTSFFVIGPFATPHSIYRNMILT